MRAEKILTNTWRRRRRQTVRTMYFHFLLWSALHLSISNIRYWMVFVFFERAFINMKTSLELFLLLILMEKYWFNCVSINPRTHAYSMILFQWCDDDGGDYYIYVYFIRCLVGCTIFIRLRSWAQSKPFYSKIIYCLFICGWNQVL